MAERTVLANQKKVLKNQAGILANQANQAKILANQKRIPARALTRSSPAQREEQDAFRPCGSAGPGRRVRERRVVSAAGRR